MSRVKVALDCDIPQRLTAPMNALYGDRGFEFIHVRDMGMGRSEDEDWAKAFTQFGGRVAISADKRIATRPNKLLAFQESALKAYFMEPPWSNQPLHFKAGHMIYWWPAIEGHILLCNEGECWQVPFSMKNANHSRFKGLKIPDDVLQRFKKAAV